MSRSRRPAPGPGSVGGQAKGAETSAAPGSSEGRNVPGAPVFLTGLGSDPPVHPPVSAGPDRSAHRSLLISSGLLFKNTIKLDGCA